MSTEEITALDQKDLRAIIKDGEPEIFSPADILILETKTEVVISFIGYSGERPRRKKTDPDDGLHSSEKYVDAHDKMFMWSQKLFSNPEEKIVAYLYSTFKSPFMAIKNGGLGLDQNKPVKMTIEEFKNTHDGKTPLDFIEEIRCKDN